MKNKFLKIICVCLILISLFSLCACKKNDTVSLPEETEIYSEVISETNPLQDAPILEIYTEESENAYSLIITYTINNKEEWKIVKKNILTSETSLSYQLVAQHEDDWIIIEKETIDKVTKQLFGIDLPNYYPHEKDLYRNGTTFYILLSSTKEENDVIATYKFIRNLKNEITFKDTEGIGYIYYELKKSDNELGFIIKSLNCTGDSPAIITKPEMTTKQKTDISEEYTYDIENLITSTLHN